MASIALIGCGRIGFLLENDPLRKKPASHFGGINSAGLKIRWACDTDTDRLNRFGSAAKINKSGLFTNYNDLLKNSPEIVSIATWTHTHAQIVISAAESGAKVIICEKPIAHDISAAKRMIDACKLNGSLLIINHERRFDPRYRTVKKLIDKGKIGELISVRGILPARGLSQITDPSIGGGPLLHDGTHLIDIISWFAGKFISADGRLTRYRNNEGYEDFARAMLLTENKIPVYIEVGGDTAYFGFGIEIFGKKGKIEIGNGYQRLFLAKKSRLYKGFNDLTETDFPHFSATGCFTELYKEAARSAKGKSDFISTGNDGLHALNTIHGIYLSALKNKELSIPIKKIDLTKIIKHRF